MTATVKKLLVGSAVLGLCACDSVLTTSPESFIGSTRFYQTPAQIERAVIGAYSYLQTTYGGATTAPAWTIGEMRSDNTTYQYNASQRGSLNVENVDEFLTSADNATVQNMWTFSYQMVQQTNVVLNRIGTVAYPDSAAKLQAIGEMRFLRAFAYFNLVRSFGAVPLLLQEVDSYAGAFTPTRTPVDSVYAQIIADVTDAILRLPTKATLPPAQTGRATRGAAAMLLADVYMTRKRYADAIPLLQSVLGMGYALVTPYEKVFDPGSKNGPESIFDVQYAEAVLGGSSSYLFRFIPFNSTNELTFVSTDIATGTGGWNIPTRSMLRAYEPNDQRRPASIAWYVKRGNAAFTDVAVGDSIPFVRKFYHSYSTAGRTNDNFPVYRFAEAKLLLAEALNETGQTAAAYAHINDVRTRAGLPSVAPTLSQAAFRDTVAHEERVELAFEDKRWWQLLRTGLALSVMNAHGAEIKSYTVFRSGATYNVTQNSLLLPIPIRELTLNKFPQNPGD